MGQQRVDEKSNEITAIPKLLDKINIKNSVVTIDAMGTQTVIAEKIKSKRGDYVLAVKENHKTLFEDISLYFEDSENLEKIKDKGNYHRTSEKNHGSADVREYYQTNSISWLNGKKKWKGIKKYRHGYPYLQWSFRKTILHIKPESRYWTVLTFCKRSLVSRSNALAA